MPFQIIYNDDGWSSYMRSPAPMTPEDIVRRTVGVVAGTGVKTYQFCSLGGHAVSYHSSFLPRIGDMMESVDAMHVWRMQETLRHLDSLNTDPLRVVSKACKEHGIACQFSLRMNDLHHTYRNPDGSWYFPELRSPWIEQHPELLLNNGGVNYLKPEILEYRKRQIQEILNSYDIDGIDLDFTRFAPWFPEGSEEEGRPLMTMLIRDIREMTRGKTLSARLDYSPETCIGSGLDPEAWFAERLLDHVSLGGGADHTPDASSEWWIKHGHRGGCKVYPSLEGQLHWFVTSGGGGSGLHAGEGVYDGYGPPSIEYMRAVAAVHYERGADGISMYNFTCADGPFNRAAFTELANPEALRGKSKQYVATMWQLTDQIFCHPWTSRFRLGSDQEEASEKLVLADDFSNTFLPPSKSTLTLDFKGLNALSEIEVRINGKKLVWNGYHYNHYDHGFWNDIVQFEVPSAFLRSGQNTLSLHRLKRNPGFTGSLEVRKCVLDIAMTETFAPGTIE